MAYSANQDCCTRNIPLYFYRVKEDDESLEAIAAKLNVNMDQINWESAGSQPQAGDIVVVNLR